MYNQKFRIIGHIISDLALLSQNVIYLIYKHIQQHLAIFCFQNIKQ